MTVATPLRAVFLAAALLPPGAATPAAEPSLSVESWALDEATTAALVEDHRAPLVSLSVGLPAGSWSPWVRDAHAEEAWKIQTFDRVGALRARTDRLSAGLVLTVEDRASTLSASCLKEDLPRVLDLVRDVLANCDFDRHELDRWQEDRQISWETSQKEPFFRAAQAAVRVLFPPGDPRRLAWEKPQPVETEPKRLAVARDVLLRLPGRVIAFAGDLTRPEVERAAAGVLPPAAKEPPAGLEPRFHPVLTVERRQKNVTVLLPRLTQTYFGYGRESLILSDSDYPSFLVADHVLGGHFYSRLYVALRHEGGETYGAGTRNYGDVVVGLYGLGTFTRAANAAVTERKLRDVLRRFAESGMTEEERVAAIGYLTGRRAFDRQSPDQVLRRWLHERSLGLPPGFLDDLAEKAARVPLTDINNFIARFYDPGFFAMVRVAPKE